MPNADTTPEAAERAERRHAGLNPDAVAAALGEAVAHMEHLVEVGGGVSVIKPNTLGGTLEMVKAGMLDGYWVTFPDGRFTLEVRQPGEDPSGLLECCQVVSVTPVDIEGIDDLRELISPEVLYG